MTMHRYALVGILKSLNFPSYYLQAKIEIFKKQEQEFHDYL